MATEKLEEHTCEFFPIRQKKKNRDRWGRYFNLSGYEEKGHCFWCGKELKKSNKRYCDDECHCEYLNHFLWSYARIWCLKRHHNTCQICGSQETLDVHHIIPVGDSGYGWNVLNRPENLITLCKRCHGKVRAKIISSQIQNEKRQLMLF